MGEVIQFPLPHKEKEPERFYCKVCHWALPFKMRLGVHFPPGVQVTMMADTVFNVELQATFVCPGCGIDFKTTMTFTEKELAKK